MAFFLLSGKTDTTPTAQDELELLQAGLGKRTLSITKDLRHEEVMSSISLYIALPPPSIDFYRYLYIVGVGRYG